MAELGVPVAKVAHILQRLDNTPRVVAALQDPKIREQFEFTVYTGLDDLIFYFNSLSSAEIDKLQLSGVRALKQKLGEMRLPRLGDISSQEFTSGLREATPLMLRGQEIRRGTFEGSPEETEAAIGTPSMPTQELALAVGAAAHLTERAIMAHMKRKGIGDWKKDDILFALEEIALFIHAEHEILQDDMFPDSPLYPFIVQPNSQGGLGWRNEEHARVMQKNLEALLESQLY